MAAQNGILLNENFEFVTYDGKMQSDRINEQNVLCLLNSPRGGQCLSPTKGEFIAGLIESQVSSQSLRMRIIRAIKDTMNDYMKLVVSGQGKGTVIDFTLK